MLIVGHRGAKGYEPENTILSFQKAVDCGVQAIEFDVRLSSDRIPMVIHDETLDRTTNGKGPVAALDASALKKLDAGKGERIPTLDEALDFAAENQLIAFVELKEERGADSVIEAMKQHRSHAIAISFLADTLKYIAFQNVRLATGLIFNRPIRHALGFASFAQSCGATWLLGRCDVLEPDFITHAHQQGFKVEAWVANDTETARKAAALGVDAIASDCPDVLTALWKPISPSPHL